MKAKTSLMFMAVLLAFALVAGCSRGTSDAQISSNVQQKIASDGNIQSKQINVQSANGVVTLSGTVASDMERASAANDAATVPGVKTVVNNLQVGQSQVGEVQPPAEPAESAQPARQSAASRRHGAAASSRSNRPESNTIARDTTTTNMAAANTAASVPAAPAPPRTVTIPDGTEIAVRLVDPVDSEKSQAGDTFHATLAQPLMVGDETVIPTGADVEGRVVEAKNAAHFSGSSSLTLELTRLMVNGRSYQLRTSQWSKQGTARGKNTAAKVGGGAALGAIIGGIAGGGKGAAIGAGVGAGAGTGVQAATRGQQVKLGPEAMISFQLESPLTVTPVAHRNRE